MSRLHLRVTEPEMKASHVEGGISEAVGPFFIGVHALRFIRSSLLLRELIKVFVKAMDGAAEFIQSETIQEC